MLIDEKLYDYTDKYSYELPIYLQELMRETAMTTVNPFMACGPVLGRFLIQMSKWIKPRTILEIGSFTGYSAICLSEGLSNEGMITCIEVNEEYKSIIEKYFSKAGRKSNLQLIIGDALKTLPSITTRFDLVFIDANKQHNDQLLELVLPVLSDQGTLLIDNTLWYGNVLQEDMDKETTAIHEFNKKLANDSRLESFIIPIRDGITMVKRK